MCNKKRVIFVGSFLDKAVDGSVGGQMFACKSLIDSSLSNEIDWILLDTTGVSVPPPSLFKRGLYAFSRLFEYLFLIITKSPASILIFAGSGASVVEKGLMAILGKMLGRRIIFAPRGGGIVFETESNKLFRYYVKLIFIFCDTIICQGKYWEAFFKSILNPKESRKLVVIPNWIDISKYKFNLLDTNNEINIVSMGWMDKEKGVQDLYEALINLDINDEIIINVYYLGDGTLRQSLIEKCEKIDEKFKIKFFFPGWVYGKEKLDYLFKADIFVLASYFEGMPNSLIEAMASGKSCISSDVGAVPDLIINNVNGFLFTPGDINQLRKKLEILITNKSLRQEFGENAYKTILENHTLENVVTKFKEIL